MPLGFFGDNCVWKSKKILRPDLPHTWWFPERWYQNQQNLRPSILTVLNSCHIQYASSLEVKYWLMVSFSIAIGKFRYKLTWNNLKVRVIASMCVAMALIRSTVLNFDSPQTRLKLQRVSQISSNWEKIFQFCLHHVKDKANIDLEQALTQIMMGH